MQQPSKYQTVSCNGPLPPTKRGYGLHVTYGALNERVDGKPAPRDKICYGAGSVAIIRDVQDTNQITSFHLHQGKVTAVSPSPNGNWVASGDDTGTVYVWPYPYTANSNPKNTLRIGQQINELRWTADSAMILAAGVGTTEFAKAFRFDSQNPLGKIDRMVKPILSADWSPIKPHRVVVTTEDNEVLFYHGVPFKYDSASRLHTRYPNIVRFSPDGKYFATAGSDSQIILYNGQTGEKVADIKDTENGHKGSIFSLAWKADSTEIVTASADKTVKIWNVAESKVIHTWTSALYGTFEDQQASVMWPATSEPISVTITGAIEFWSRTEEKPVKVLAGHHANISAVKYDRKTNTLYTGDLEGRLVATDANSGAMAGFAGVGHEATLSAIAVGEDGAVYTTGADNNIRKQQAGVYKAGDVLAAIPNNAKALAVVGDIIVAATATNLISYNVNSPAQPVQTEKFAADKLVVDNGKIYATSVSAKTFRIYTVSATGLNLEKEVAAEFTAPQDVAISPSGQIIAVEGNHVIPWKTDFSGPQAFGWEYHTSPILSVAISPAGKLAATVGADRQIIVWTDLETFKGSKNVVQRIQETYIFVDFIDEENLIVVTQDNLIKKIALKF